VEGKGRKEGRGEKREGASDWEKEKGWGWTGKEEIPSVFSFLLTKLKIRHWHHTGA